MTLRMGIVGCGSIAESMHIPAIQKSRSASLTALIDPNPQRLQKLAKKHPEAHCASNLKSMDNYLDAVVLCAPPHLHAQLALEAFSLGLHVLCEKPMASTLKECQEMLHLAKETGRTLAMAHIFRFYPVRKKIKHLIEQCEHGPLKSVHAEIGNLYSWKTVTGYNMKRQLVPGGVLFDAGIHPLDTILWWCGTPVSIEYEDDSLGGLESNARLSLGFQNGAVGFLRISRTCQLSNNIVLNFEDVNIKISNYSTCYYTKTKNAKTENIEVQRNISPNECAVDQIEDFCTSCITGSHPHVPAEEGLRTIQVIGLCYRKKRAIPLPTNAPIPGITS